MLSVDVEKTFPGFKLKVSFCTEVSALAVFGPSGAGKSTLLHIIAGLIRPDRGEIRLGEKVLYSSEKSINIPPEKRKIGMVFQKPYLFPHLTVKGNLYYGYRPDKQNESVDPHTIIKMLDIEKLLERRTAKLSGGEQQRVALGRALLAAPEFLLLDEPLVGLDQSLKNRIIPYLKRIRYDLGLPFIYVTHTISEMLELTGQVLAMNEGASLDIGNFFEVIHDPLILTLAEQHGFENVLHATVEKVDEDSGLLLADYRGQRLTIPCHTTAETPYKPGNRIFISIRADNLMLTRELPQGISDLSSLKVSVLEVAPVGGRVLVYLKTPNGDNSAISGGKQLVAEITPQGSKTLNPQPGETLFCIINTHSIHFSGSKFR